VGNETKNYKFPKPSEDDFYDISEYNKALDILDETLTEMSDRKLDSNGNASDVVTEFSQEILRNNIESGEKLSVSHGKVQKWFSEMKNIAFSGLASDVAQDAAHRYVTDTEKNGWNAKVSASGGDISGTKIGSLENITTGFPVPAEGETPKVFLGKVKKFIEDTKGRYLEADVAYYVATTGSDDTGEGTQNKPFKTVQKAVNMVPKDLGGHTITLNIAGGTYAEPLNISGYHSGKLVVIGSSTGKTIMNGASTRHIISDCSAMITISYLEFKSPTAVTAYEGNVICTNDTSTAFLFCIFDGQNSNLLTNALGINIVSSTIELDTCVFNNCAVCIYTPVLDGKSNPPGHISIKGCTGTGNVVPFICQGSTFYLKDNLLPTGTDPRVIAQGGLVVKSQGAIISTLMDNTILYVATTGDDSTGDGTSEKPYKTIQRVLSILPKDLGNHRATIYLADGIYPDQISISAFYNGTLYIRPTAREDTLSDACTIGNIYISQNLCHVHFNSVKVVGSGTTSEISISAARLTRLASVKITNANLNINAISAFNMSEVVVTNCEISNHANALYSDNATVFITYCTGSGNNYVLNVSSGGRINHSGTIPSGIVSTMVQNSGGAIFNDSGTQISGMISAGLSCTWGTVSGGYVRHGNLSGRAIVTVMLRVIQTAAMNAGTSYYINGFPSVSAGVAIALSCSHANQFNDIYVTGSTAVLVPAINLAIGNDFVLTTTYITEY
jgi:hypothetical protein